VDESSLRSWETLFERALQIIDSAGEENVPPERWSFGGGTVLMRRYRHRFSKDIDIFVPDPQYLGYVSPRLNDAAEGLVSQYNEQANFLKLYFPEGEIDFVVARPLTSNPYRFETILGRDVQVETSIEILAKKIYHRARDFTARDIFDFALLAEKEPASLATIGSIIRERREELLNRMNTDATRLRTVFAQLATLDYQRTYEECANLVRTAIARA
jgi:predicted nucleotidyltransferase component of viral defense system